MVEDLGIPEEYNIPADLPGEELNVRIDPVDGYLPARPEAIDTYRDVVGNPITGSNPSAGSSGTDFLDSLANGVKKKIDTPQEGDEYYKMRPYTYSGDFDAANFDRYYGTRAYKTLGFSPYRDNESLYNDKLNFVDQFVRSYSQWDNVLFNGFKSGVTTWGDVFTDPLAPDLESAKEFQRSMAIGTINTGGIGGFIGNTALNAMYGIGIGLEFIAEEAALTAATAFSGGLLGEATAPAMLSRGTMFAKQLGKIGEFGAKAAGRSAEYAKSFDKGMDAYKAAETAAQFAKNIKKTEGAIDRVSSARQFFNKAVSGAFDLVNPFEETFKSLKSTVYASNYAKTIGSSGAFIDDIIRIKMAASEAKLEGGMVQIDATKKLIDEYRTEHGKDPEGEDLKKIETLARLEGERTVLYNYPAIMATNKLLFKTILYPLTKIKGGTTGRLLQDVIPEGGIKANSQDIFKKVGTGPGAQMKAAAKSLIKPKVYGSYGMNYLKANIGEGFQENIQEAISAGAIEHALAVQSDPAMAAYQGFTGHLMNGLEEQLSAQGAETFASGFLMGTFTQPIMTAPVWGLTKGIERLKSKEARDEIKKQRDEAADKKAQTLNNLANNDLRYWFSDAITTVKNNALNNDMVNQASIGDIKGARDSQFAIEFNHIDAVSGNGTFDVLMDKLKDYKNLTPAEALDAFKRQGIGIETEEDAMKALDHLDSVIDRAYKIKEQFQEVASEFPNFYKLTGLSPNSPEYTAMVISYKAWQEAQRNLVFAKSAFDEYASRTKGVTEAFSSLASEIAKGDAQTLQSVMTIPNLKMEISTLKRELSSLGEVEGQGEVKRDKKKKLELLENFQESILAAQDKIASENITDYLDKQSVYGQAKKDFQKLLTHLAKKNDTILFNTKADKAFGMLVDNLEMKDQMQGLAQSINVLNSPKGFLNLQNRIFTALDEASRSENRLQRIRENIGKFYVMNDENEIILTLGKLGLKLPEGFIEEYKEALDKGIELPTPEKYIDPSTGEEIDYLNDGDRYLKADELWQAFKYWMQETRLKSPEELAKEKKKAEDAVAAMQFDSTVLETFPPILAENLKAMHLTALESGDVAKDQTLKEFVETNPNALQEIKLYKAQMVSQIDWVGLIEKAGSGTELDAIIDQIDKLNAMTPDLLDLIPKKRATFSEAAPTTPVDNKADIDILAKAVMSLPFNTIQNLGNLLSTKGAFKEMEDLADVIAKVYYDGTNPELIKAVDDAMDAAREKQMAEGDAELAALEGKPEETPETKKTRKTLMTDGFPLEGGRRAVWNRDLKTWDFYTKTGKRITNKKDTDKLTTSLGSKKSFALVWWDFLLTESDRDKVREVFENYEYLAKQNVENNRQQVEQTEHLILMEALQGAKFKRESKDSVAKHVTDIGPVWLTNGEGYEGVDEFITDSLPGWYNTYRMDAPADKDQLANDVYDMLDTYNKGITDKAIRDFKEEISGSDMVNLTEDFAKEYGMALENLYWNLDALQEDGRLTNPLKEIQDTEPPFNKLSTGDKFKTAVEELKDHKMLTGTLTADNYMKDYSPEYYYQVTLDDGRTIPVPSEFYFNPLTPSEIYRNKPRIRLVLVDFRGKPAVEVRSMESGYEDVRITYIREKEIKHTKDIKDAVSQADIENADVFYHLDMTLEEMNKNISQATLAVAKHKGYDVIYKNIPYLVTRVDQKSVSLRSLDNKIITVPISDITEIRDGKGIIKNQVDIETAKINQSTAGSILTTLDDSVSLDSALKSIKVNKCK